MAFNIHKEICKIVKLKHDFIYGLPNRKHKGQKQQVHISNIVDYEMQAEMEGNMIKRSYIGSCTYFDIRLKRNTSHKPGGVY